MNDMKIFKSWTKSDDHAALDVNDSTTYPEINHVAEVRRGLGICNDEAQFVVSRRIRMKEYFARYLDLDPDDVDPDDIPIIALGGSGGGYRAMLGMLAYSSEMKRRGLFDLLMYISGVSGSCWAIAAYYTFGGCDWDHVIEHCKERFGVHPLDGQAIRAVLSAPGGVQMAFGPLEIKTIAGLHVVPMDYYSVFTSGHIFLHGGPGPGSQGVEFAGFKQDWFKFTNVQDLLVSGAEPMPIMTAIRHERPWKDWTDPEHPFVGHDAKGEQIAGAWYQWFEMTPFEVGSDELEAWVPTWGFGRPFSEGKSIMQLPEHSLALLLGLCTSAPAGSMSSYIATIQRNLPANFIGSGISYLAKGVSKWWGKHGTDVFENHHPLHACNEHNFCFHLSKVNEGEGRPPGLENSPRIHLIDSGMDNNCPTYVMLHPSRNVDVVINMDASSDVAKDPSGRINHIGGRKGIKFTKRPQQTKQSGDHVQPPYAQVFDGVLGTRPETVVDSFGKTVPTPPGPTAKQDCTMVYLPLLGNESAIMGFDPTTAKFSSSYNLSWKPYEVETLVKVCIANFVEAESTIKQVIRESYEAKKAKRMQYS